MKRKLDSGRADEPTDATETIYAKAKLFAEFPVTGQLGRKSEELVCALCEDNENSFTEKPIACQVLI